METIPLTYLLMSYREDLDVFFLRWQNPVSSDELRLGYKESLERADLLRARFWLFDLRSRGAASDEDEAWILNSFLAMAGKKLGHDTSFAYLVLPTHYSFIQKTIGLEKLSRFSALIKINLFTSEKEALQWLSQRRQMLQQSA